MSGEIAGNIFWFAAGWTCGVGAVCGLIWLWTHQGKP